MARRLMFAVHKVAGLLLCAVPWGAAQALIDINPKVVEMKDEQSVVRVINTGNTPEFVEIKLSLVGNPGVPPEEEQRTPLGLIKEPTLYAAPFKLSLGPRQEKIVQLHALRQPQTEQVFRLSVIPQQQVNLSGFHNNVILVSLGYNGLVRQLPAKHSATWGHRCQESQVRLEATGSVRVEFTELLQDSQSVEDFNVYPGTPRVIQAKRLSGKVESSAFDVKCDG